MTKPPADALLFDLGGVVMGLDWDPMFRRWAEACGGSPGELRRRWVHDEAYERHERGEIGEAEYFAGLRKSLGAEIDDRAFREGWAAIFTGPIHETVALLEAFDFISREIGVPQPRILFFDDTLENVEGARAAGLQAVHVRGPDDVRRAVRPWLDAT